MALVATVGCGADQSRGGKVPGDTLTIFSSLRSKARTTTRRRASSTPRSWPSGAGGGVGEYKVNFASRTTRPRATKAAGIRAGQPRTPARPRGHTHDRLHRRVRLGATAISVPSPTRPGSRRSVPVDGGGRRSYSRGRKGGAGQVLPVRERASHGSSLLMTYRPRRRRGGPAASVPAACSCSATRASRVTASWSFTGRGRAGGRVAHRGRDRMDPRADDYVELAAEIAERARTRSISAVRRPATRCGSGATWTTPCPRSS